MFKSYIKEFPRVFRLIALRHYDQITLLVKTSSMSKETQIFSTLPIFLTLKPQISLEHIFFVLTPYFLEKLQTKV